MILQALSLRAGGTSGPAWIAGHGTALRAWYLYRHLMAAGLLGVLGFPALPVVFFFPPGLGLAVVENTRTVHVLDIDHRAQIYRPCY